ncbi:MAG: penicillin-binding protein activator [Woeseiaceae bacterium]|nr:penicillin-binding protein activator [Woeseiaceae bacterium]
MIAAAVLLSGCAGTPATSGVRSGERDAAALAAAGRHSEAAGRYIGLASEATGRERDRLTLLAVEQWLDAGDGRRARSALSEVTEPGDTGLDVLWKTNRAAVLLWEGKPDAALDILRPLAATAMSTERRIRAESLRGDAWFQKRDPIRAINVYLQLEQALIDEAEIRVVRERLWAGLLVSDPQVLRASAQVTSSALIRGWLELGALAVRTGRQGIGWANGLGRWRNDFAGHPAVSILDDAEPAEPGMLGYPRQLALLLPLSGRSRSLGTAIQNGFLAAYYQAAAGMPEPQQIRVYDVAETGSARRALSRAVEDGAEFVVGPLMPDAVAQVAAEAPLPVPVLTLNYLPDSVPRPQGLYQFALSPEDEAAAAAQRAVADGRRLAVALIPNSDWGRRMLSSFVGEFEKLGGTLLEYRFYQPSDQDFSFEIENLMGLALSIQRYQRLRANLGLSMQFEPRRREDADFIFIAADAPEGRLLKSQLKFHYSGDLPVYSTSRIYAEDGRSNADLDGVGFADTPWTIAPPAWIAELPATFREFWPDQQSLLLSRLNAMGYDAFSLVNAIHGSSELSLDGATGRLYLDDRGRIRRELPWAEFDNGVPVARPSAQDTGPLPDEATILLDATGAPNGDTPPRVWSDSTANP